MVWLTVCCDGEVAAREVPEGQDEAVSLLLRARTKWDELDVNKSGALDGDEVASLTKLDQLR